MFKCTTDFVEIRNVERVNGECTKFIFHFIMLPVMVMSGFILRNVVANNTVSWLR